MSQRKHLRGHYVNYYYTFFMLIDIYTTHIKWGAEQQPGAWKSDHVLLLYNSKVCVWIDKRAICKKTLNLWRKNTYVCRTQSQPSYLVVTVPMRGVFYLLTVDCRLFSGCSLIHRPAKETKQEDRDTREGVAHLERKQAGKMKSWCSCRRCENIYI